MKREIKFRGKSTNTGKWHYGLFCYDWDPNTNLKPAIQSSLTGMESSFSKTIIDIETLGQYTGLKDRNGKEIYEGDIWIDINMDHWIHGEVVFHECRWCIKWDNSSYGDLFTNVTTSIMGKIIHNIYENPELLQTQKP